MTKKPSKSSIAGIIFCMVVFAISLAAQRSPKFREVTIATEPGASVRIDGILFGTADSNGILKIKSIPPGRRLITVRADGFSEISKALLPTQSGRLTLRPLQKADQGELAFQEGVRLSSVDREKAAEAFRRAIRLRSKFIPAYLDLARDLQGGGDAEGALNTISELRKISPANAEVSAIEGRIYKDLGDQNRAIRAFKRAIAEGKGFQPEAYAGIGLLYKEKAEGLAGDPDETLSAAAYTEAAKNLAVAVDQLSGAPDAIVIYQLLGLIYENQHKFKEAIATYEAFLRIFPDVSEAEAVRSFIVQIKKQMASQIR